MGCSPTKEGKSQDAQGDIEEYKHPDLDMASYHFNEFVQDLITVDGGVQKFLNVLYKEWPIPNPKEYKSLKRYGYTYETWPQTDEQLLHTIAAAEAKMNNTILGAKLEKVSVFFKQAATMKSLMTAPSEAKPHEITWPDVQYMFKQELLKLNNETCLPKHVDMLSEHPKEENHFRISLRYRVAKEQIKSILEGEWRIFHQPGNAGGKGAGPPPYSYGMMINEVLGCGAAAGKGGKGPGAPAEGAAAGDEITFKGSDRLNKKYTVDDGKCFWNEKGNSHVRMTWTEKWHDGKEVPMEAKLKVNGKFECTNVKSGEVKKGSREDNFPLDAHARLQIKYYMGDKDAAFEDKIPFPDLIKGAYDWEQCENMLRQIFMEWPTKTEASVGKATVDAPPAPAPAPAGKGPAGKGPAGKGPPGKGPPGKGPAPKAAPPAPEPNPEDPVKINRKGKDIKTWPLSAQDFGAMLQKIGGDCAAVGEALTEYLTTGGNTEAKPDEVAWPDVQLAYSKAGHTKSADADELRANYMLHPKVTLMVKIPLCLVDDVLEGEWRMYCKGDGVTNRTAPFSYGMYITDVKQVEDDSLPPHAKKFTYSGSSRVAGKWNLEKGIAVWNELHTGRVRLEYTEAWCGKGGTRDDLEARLKVNHKFECLSTKGFIQKARREDTLPVDPHERMKLKYYLGDRDAAFEIDPNLTMSFSDLCQELGPAGCDTILTHIFFEWPTLPAKISEIDRYKQKRKTWPISPDMLKDLIMKDGFYKEKQANSIIGELFENGGCECSKEANMVIWPDVQFIFRQELKQSGEGVKMLDEACNLTLKIPEDKISEMLCGEWRMYCKSTDEGSEAFSYGLIIDSVTEVESIDRDGDGPGRPMKRLTFTGRPRQQGKYEVKEGKCTWNEFGSGRLFLDYKECWPNGTEDALVARLKCNGKFHCESTAGFIQKARKEETLPTSTKLRMESKYYAGDTDAAVDANE